jgi:two-component system CheB/CheR fusion protein
VAAYSEGEGRGSEFVVRLPAAATPEARRDEGPTPGPRGRRDEPAPGPVEPKRVLIVDDNMDGARMLARLLRTTGHQVEVAYDGPSALESVRAHPPEVVLLDIGLPGMDGYEVARRIRQLDGLDQPLLVALTGYGQAEDRRRALEVGFDDHLIKPVSPDDLAPLFGLGRAAPRQRSAAPRL